VVTCQAVCPGNLWEDHYTTTLDLYNFTLVSSTSMWEVEFTDQFERWWNDLDEGDQEAIVAAVEFLEERGPALGRPFVDTIKSSRHANMKELIPMATNIRVLFAFDPRRTAILLIGGDKTDRWDEWYREKVPVADGLYDEHLRALEEEGEER